MKRIIQILLFLLPVGLFAQTPIGDTQVDTFYLSGILNGQYQIFKASEFLSGGGGADNLGNHTATASLNMDGNEIDSVSVLNLFDTDADANFWAFFEDANGELVIQDNAAATDDLKLNQDGTIEIGNAPPTENSEVWLLMWDDTSNVIEKRAVSSLPAGGGGSGTTLYFFSARDTSTTALTINTWNTVTWDTEFIENASFTHAANAADISFDSAGTYIITVTLLVNFSNRVDCFGGINIDTGSGYSATPTFLSQFPIHFATSPTFPDLGLTLTYTHVAADTNDKMRCEIYPENAAFTYDASMIHIQRIE